jgi:ADP-ribosyl-[dinitrogen reductase] hydrolase
MAENLKDSYQGCLLSLAAGDALGAPVEFRAPGAFEPVAGMRSGGVWRISAGQWTDDTSLALCLAHSLIKQKGFSPGCIMDNFLKWRKEGFMSSTGKAFDVGHTTDIAIQKFARMQDPYSGPTSPDTAGNGSIMRLAPIPLFYYPQTHLVIHYAAESSKLTHGASEAVESCQVLAGMISRALDGESKEDILFANSFENTAVKSSKLAKIVKGEYRDKKASEIVASGYVINSLEAALWSFLKTDTLADALLTAVNLGYDADTTAAVCGQVAGAYYGASQLPKEWTSKLSKYDLIRDYADHLFKMRGENNAG